MKKLLLVGLVLVGLYSQMAVAINHVWTFQFDKEFLAGNGIYKINLKGAYEKYIYIEVVGKRTRTIVPSGLSDPKSEYYDKDFKNKHVDSKQVLITDNKASDGSTESTDVKIAWSTWCFHDIKITALSGTRLGISGSKKVKLAKRCVSNKFKVSFDGNAIKIN